MFPRPLLLATSFLLGMASFASGADPTLALDPVKPEVGKSAKVVFTPAPANPAAGEFKWEVQVFDGENKDVTSTVFTAAMPDSPTLDILVVKPKLAYKFKLSLKSTSVTYSLEAESTTKFLQVTATPAATPATSTSPTAPTPPTIGEKITGDSLEAAKRWAEQIVALPKSENLVIPVDFFKAALAKTTAGKDGITEFSHRPLLEAAELHRAMYAAANRFSTETDVDHFISAWHDERKNFLESLPQRSAATTNIVNLWMDFIDRWEKKAIAESKARFREALLQAPLIVTALLLDFDKQHIEAAMTGGPVTTASSGGGYSGTSHAAVHHARAMSRIRYRHERRMARIGY